MKRVMTIGVACAALFVGATAADAKPKPGHGEHGNHGSSEAAKLCAALKKADKEAFKAVWGKHAMRDCIRANRGDDGSSVGEETSDFVNAAQECRAERDLDPAAFAINYGTNHNLRNAFGKCVSEKVHEDENGGGTA